MKILSSQDACRLVRDLTETWEDSKALQLSGWCERAGLTGAASLLRVATDRGSPANVRGSALRALSLAFGLERPVAPRTKLSEIADAIYAKTGKGRSDKEIRAQYIASKTAKAAASLPQAEAYGKLSYSDIIARQNAREASTELRRASEAAAAASMPASLPPDVHDYSDVVKSSTWDGADDRVADILASKDAIADIGRASEALYLPPTLYGPIGPAPAPIAETSVLGFPRTRILGHETVVIRVQVAAVTKIQDLSIGPAEVADRLMVASLRLGRHEMLLSPDPVPASAFVSCFRNEEILELRKMLEKHFVTSRPAGKYTAYECQLCEHTALHRRSDVAHAETCILHKKPAPPFFENAPTLQPGSGITIALENIGDVHVDVSCAARCLVMCP